MNRLLVAVLLLGVAPVFGQETGSGPQTALTTTYSFNAQDGTGSDWVASQAASLGLTGRWGQSLKLEGQVKAPFDGSALTSDALIQQLALAWNLNEWSVVTFGKQRLKWGTSRVFSAVDGLEPTYDPLHPQAVLDGVTGIKVEVLPTDWLSLSALVLPTAVLKDSKRALRLDVLWDDTDLSAGAIHSVASGTNRATFYADFARFFDRFGVYGEASVKSFRDRDWTFADASGKLGVAGPEVQWTPKATVGTQVEIPVWMNGTLRWLTEYHFNGEGFSASEASDFAGAYSRKRAAPTLTSLTVPATLSVATFSRHYGYTGLSGLPVTEKLSLSTSALVGLDTGFFIGRGGAWYSVDQSLSVSLDYSRFDMLPGTSHNASERIFVSQTNQVTLTVTGSY